MKSNKGISRHEKSCHLLDYERRYMKEQNIINYPIQKELTKYSLYLAKLSDSEIDKLYEIKIGDND